MFSLSRLRTLVVAILFLLPGAGAEAFFQTTTVEGTIGRDLGGIWLLVHNTAPQFRVRIDKDAAASRMQVGEISPETRRLLGHGGVVITGFKDTAALSEAQSMGVFEGDVILKVNSEVVEDLASYREALETVPEAMFLGLIRPALRRSEARVVKLRYSATVGELDGQSAVVSEQVDFRLLESVLPFADEIEKANRASEPWTATAEQVAAVKGSWHKLPLPERRPFVRGEYTMTAADSYDSSLRRDRNIDDTIFAVVGKLQGSPMLGGGQRIMVWGFRDFAPGKANGTLVDVTMGSAPFPISIEFKGTFEMMRLADWADTDNEVLAERKAAEARKKAAAYDDIELAPDVPAAPGP